MQSAFSSLEYFPLVFSGLRTVYVCMYFLPVDRVWLDRDVIQNRRLWALVSNWMETVHLSSQGGVEISSEVRDTSQRNRHISSILMDILKVTKSSVPARYCWIIKNCFFRGVRLEPDCLQILDYIGGSKDIEQ